MEDKTVRHNLSELAVLLADENDAGDRSYLLGCPVCGRSFEITVSRGDGSDFSYRESNFRFSKLAENIKNKPTRLEERERRLFASVTVDCRRAGGCSREA